MTLGAAARKTSRDPVTWTPVRDVHERRGRCSAVAGTAAARVAARRTPRPRAPPAMSKPPRFASLRRSAADSSRSRSRRAIASRPATLVARLDDTGHEPSQTQRAQAERDQAVAAAATRCRPARAPRTSARLARRSIRRRPRSRPQKRSCSRRAPTSRGSRRSLASNAGSRKQRDDAATQWRWPTRASAARASGYARQLKAWRRLRLVRVPKKSPPPAPGSRRRRRRSRRSPRAQTDATAEVAGRRIRHRQARRRR